MKRRSRLLPLALFLVGLSARAENLCETAFDQDVGPITQTMEQAKDPGRWKLLEKFLAKFRACLDGSSAETTQSITENALAHDWKGFSDYLGNGHPNRKTLAEIEAGFSVEMGDPKNLALIQKSAKTACPKQVRKFCARILRAKL